MEKVILLLFFRLILETWFYILPTSFPSTTILKISAPIGIYELKGYSLATVFKRNRRTNTAGELHRLVCFHLPLRLTERIADDCRSQ